MVGKGPIAKRHHPPGCAYRFAHGQLVREGYRDDVVEGIAVRSRVHVLITVH